MDNQSIMYRDPELEASFSFSGYDFTNSSDLCVFSDVEDHGDNDDEYIEIELQQPTKYADYNEDDQDGDDDDGDGDGVDGLELRISFSSSVPFLELSHNNDMTTGLSRTTIVESLGCESIQTLPTPSSSTSSSTSTSTLSCSSAETYWAAAASASDQQLPSSTIQRKVQFRSVNRLLGSFLSIPRTPSEIKEKSSDDLNSPEHESNKQVAIHTRKSPKIRKTANGGIMMKLLIKCRSINIRTLLASLVKPYQIIINAPTSGGGQKKKKKRSWKSNNKSGSSSLGLVQRDHKASYNNNNNNGERSSRVFEMNMDAIRGVLESMSITSHGRRDKKNINKKSSSSSSSSSSSPSRSSSNSKMYATTDNSIQAAIAHCKTSFGQPSDFCF